MSFSDNLQNLRKRDNLTQDALADKLEVTKEAVSEWESGGGYPGIDKIIRICELFGCDMDTLVKGDIPAETPENDHKLKSLYEKTLNSVSTAFSAAIGIILLGLTALILISGRAEGTSYEKAFAAIGAAVLISGVAIAAPLFIVYGIKLTDFNRRHPRLPAFYTDDEVSSYFIKFGIGIGAGVVLLILGVIAALLVNALTEIKGVYIAAIVIGSIALAVPLFVFFGMRMSKYTMGARGKDDVIDYTDKACGVIMLTATAIFLIMGFLLHAWSTAWVVFPVGGILCAIVSIIFKSKNR